MIFIGENIHLISKSVKEAMIGKDDIFFKRMIFEQSHMDYVDLNVGPARGEMCGILPWLCGLVETGSGLKISLDTTNFEEMKGALTYIKNSGDVILNSTTSDVLKLDEMTDLAVEYGCNLVALTMSKETGILKTCDGRMEIAFKIYEKCLESGLAERTFFDPLVLPLPAEQSQAVEALNTLKMLREAFDVPVKTIIGLSNISNGAPAKLRRLINRVYAVLAFGAGLDAVIMDAFDSELYRILKMLEKRKPESEIDRLYIKLAGMIEDFSDLEDIDYDREDEEQSKIIKTCEILLNKKIYSDSFAQV